MSEQNLREVIRNYKELQRLAEELAQEMEAAEDTIKAELTARGVDELTAGEYKVRYTKVKSSRFDTAAFRRAMPNLAENSPIAWRANGSPWRKAVSIC